MTTALLGLDGSRLLEADAHRVDHWDQAAEADPPITWPPSKAPVTRTGQPAGWNHCGCSAWASKWARPSITARSCRISSDSSAPPVALAASLHRLFEADPSFGQAVPVIVENDVNALAVLAIHQAHYAEPDLVVVGVFDEGVGGGLVMDGRLRRGGNGRAMEIGHLAVGFPPGQQEQPPDPQEPGLGALSAGLPDFYTRCWCGHFGHVDTLAPPRRIQGMLGDVPLDQLGDIGSRDPRFKRRPARIRPQRRRPRPGPSARQQHRQSQQDNHLPAPPSGSPQAGHRRGRLPHARCARKSPAHSQQETTADYLKIRAAPPAEDLALLGARAAAVCVLESFIEHALRLDGCTTTLRRPSTGTGSFKVLSPLEQS